VDIWHLNLIRFLDFYFTLIFLANSLRRLGFYQSIARLVLATPARWPRLLQLIKQHRGIFLTWTTVVPGLLALALMLLQLLASRLVWPSAGRPPFGLTVETVAGHWQAVAVVVPLGLVMFALDLYFFIRVSTLDRATMEKHFDQAEYWLSSRTAHVVRFFTLGFVNPRKMVAVEVGKALIALCRILNYSFWWMNLQVGLRLLFGLSLWLTWVLTA